MNYAIIGQGKLASHLNHWLKLEEKNVSTFGREDDYSQLQNSDVLLLAIPDDAIENFYLKNSELHQKKWIHFSGSCHFEKILGIHPMMSFSTELFEVDFYKSLRWVTASHEHVSDLLPISPQKISYLKEEERKLYHALCVVSGNIPHLLWSDIEKRFKDLGIDKKDVQNYIQMAASNYFEDRPVTGPIVRGDSDTISQNLAVLSKSYANIYQSTMEIFNEKH